MMENDGLESHIEQLLDKNVQSISQAKPQLKSSKLTLFSDSGNKLANEEILFEFMTFMKNLPNLILPEKERLINLVRKELHIDEITNSMTNLNFSKLSSMKMDNHVISQLSRTIGQSLNILAPPTTKCLLCSENLTMNNPPSQIVVHGMNGPEVFSKYILRCRMCKLDRKANCKSKDKNRRQDVYYHPERFGNQKTGWLFYEKEIHYVKASNEVYFEKLFVESGLDRFMHGFMSMESQAEAYNQTFRNTEKVKEFKKFLAKNPSVGRHFEKKIKSKASDDEYDEDQDATEEEASVASGMFELHRKSVRQSFFNLFMLRELQERNMLGKYFFGPYFYESNGEQKLMTYKESADNFQADVDSWRTEEIYQHANCTGNIKLH